LHILREAFSLRLSFSDPDFAQRDSRWAQQTQRPPNCALPVSEFHQHSSTQLSLQAHTLLIRKMFADYVPATVLQALNKTYRHFSCFYFACR